MGHLEKPSDGDAIGCTSDLPAGFPGLISFLFFLSLPSMSLLAFPFLSVPFREHFLSLLSLHCLCRSFPLFRLFPFASLSVAFRVRFNRFIV
jgi:hypothetical protein